MSADNHILQEKIYYYEEKLLHGLVSGVNKLLHDCIDDEKFKNLTIFRERVQRV